MAIKNNSFFKKIILVFIVILLIEFTMPILGNSVQASLVTSILAKPIGYIFIFILDGFNILLAVLTKDVDNDIGFDMDDFLNNLILSVDDIFSGHVPALNANIFSVSNEIGSVSDAVNAIRGESFVRNLKKGVANIYIGLRNIAAIILLCLLIYTGIRIVLATNSYKEQAKWKMLLVDWVKALLLLIFMHVIMVGIFWISDKLVDALNGAFTSSGGNIVTLIRKAYNGTSFLSGRFSFLCTNNYVYICYIFNYCILYSIL